MVWPWCKDDTPLRAGGAVVNKHVPERGMALLSNCLSPPPPPLPSSHPLLILSPPPPFPLPPPPPPLLPPHHLPLLDTRLLSLVLRRRHPRVAPRPSGSLGGSRRRSCSSLSIATTRATSVTTCTPWYVLRNAAVVE